MGGSDFFFFSRLGWLGWLGYPPKEFFAGPCGDMVGRPPMWAMVEGYPKYPKYPNKIFFNKNQIFFCESKKFASEVKAAPGARTCSSSARSTSTRSASGGARAFAKDMAWSAALLMAAARARRSLESQTEAEARGEGLASMRVVVQCKCRFFALRVNTV